MSNTIFDVIQNGGLAAILDVNTLGAVTRTINAKWISFKLRAERMLKRVNMYANLFSDRFQK